MRTGIVTPPAAEPEEWSAPTCLTGAPGRGVKSTRSVYQASSSGTTRPTGDWLADIPFVNAGQYLWTRTQITFTDDTYTFIYWAVRMGKDGTAGDPGRGIRSIVEYYLATNSGSDITASTVGWTTTVQTITEAKRYLWNYEKITFTDDSISQSAPKIIGVYGEQGQPGKGIKTITNYYLATHAGSDITASTVGWTTTVQTITEGNRYLWNYEVIAFTDGTSTETLPTIIGVYGDPGRPGDRGKRGCIQRTSEWAKGFEYHNDEADATADPGYVDVVVRYAGAVPYFFRCLKSHRSTATNGPSQNTTTEFWQPLNNMAPIYTPLILANNAVVRIVQGQKFLVFENNIVRAGLIGGDFPLFVGGSAPASAPFRISKYGALTSSNATITGKITATSGKIGDFQISNGALLYKGQGCGYTDMRIKMSSEGLWLTADVGDSQIVAANNYNCRLIAFSAGASDLINGNLACNTYSTCARITYRNGNPALTTTSYRRNVGLAISVTGTRSTSSTYTKGNIALLLEDGELMGRRDHVRTVTTATATLDKYDTDVHVDYKAGDVNIFLPSDPPHAQAYYIKKVWAGHWLNVNGNGKKILDFKASSTTAFIRWSVQAEYKLKYNMELGYWVTSIFYT